MKLLRYLYLFREFVILSLLFITIERIISEKRLANYINPDFNIFINLSLILLLLFAAAAMILASGRDVKEKPVDAAKYAVFAVLLIVMNIPHDSTQFYAHLQAEREFTFGSARPVDSNSGGSADLPESWMNEVVTPGDTPGEIKFGSDIFKIDKENFYSASEQIFSFPEKFVNRKIQITGFVYKSRKLKDKRYIIARLVMYCCAADAGITGVIFNSEKSGGIFKKDEWLELYGHIEMESAGGGNDDKAPVLVVESYKRIPAESSPYVYPVN
jgi:putative membrane protein